MLNPAFFTEEEILKLKNTTDPELRKLVDKMVADTEKALENGGGGFTTLAFGYYYTGKKEYIDLARKEFKNQLENGLWISDEYDETKYNGYDIRTALETERKVGAMSTGISFFGDLIPEDELKYYADETYKRGILPIMEDWVLPGKRMHALDTMGHNFWIVITSAVAGATGVMVCAVRSEGEYAIDFVTKDIASIANAIKDVPADYINEAGNYVTDKCIDYILPLIAGEVETKYSCGLPVHLTI